MPVPVLIRRGRGCATRLSSLELASGHGLRGILQARRRSAGADAGRTSNATKDAGLAGRESSLLRLWATAMRP